MDELDWSDPEVPLVANFSGAPVEDAAVGARGARPSRSRAPCAGWTACERCVDAGCTDFLELGSGRVLGGLVRQIAGSDVQTVSTDSPEVLEEFAASYSGGSQV